METITPIDGVAHTSTSEDEWVLVYSDVLILKTHNDGNQTSSKGTIETFETESECNARIVTLGFEVPEEL